MFKEFGGLFGWLIIVAFGGTILNYIIKLINRRFSKKIATNPVAKRVMKVLMTIFVRNHKYFGFATAVMLLAHFIIQFYFIGLSVSGVIAAVLLILQVGLGIYATLKKKPRKGVWFITHRLIAVLLILGTDLHLVNPYGLNNIGKNEDPPKVTEKVEESPKASDKVVESPKATDKVVESPKPTATGSDTEMPTFTLEELAKYNGENGNKAYVAYDGLVYDVTNVPAWAGGMHNDESSGIDITDLVGRSPHGEAVFKRLEVVGRLAE